MEELERGGPELRTSLQRNSQTTSRVALRLSSNARRKHLRRFYSASSNLQAGTLVATCCCGNRTVCKHFSVSLGPEEETPAAAFLWVLTYLTVFNNTLSEAV